MLKVTYSRGDEDEVFGPFVDDDSANQFASELGGEPKFWVDNESRVGLRFEGGEWKVDGSR